VICKPSDQEVDTVGRRTKGIRVGCPRAEPTAVGSATEPRVFREDAAGRERQETNAFSRRDATSRYRSATAVVGPPAAIGITNKEIIVVACIVEHLVVGAGAEAVLSGAMVACG